MTAGLWSLRRLKPALYSYLALLSSRLVAGLAHAAREAGVAVQVNAVGSLLTPFFTDRSVRGYRSATNANTAQYARFFQGMLRRGIYPPPSQFEAWFLSAAHTMEDVERTVTAARAAMKDVTKGPARPSASRSAPS
jgi:glutamate-1-semialdehyde 2,1-aminomutase